MEHNLIYPFPTSIYLERTFHGNKYPGNKIFILIKHKMKMKIGLPLQCAEDQTRTTMMKLMTHLLEVATLVCEVVIAEEDVKQMKKSVVRKRISKLRAQRLIILIGDDSISTNCHARHKNMGH